MNWGGILLGGASFVIIGVLHPIVIRAEYRFGKGCWPVFLIAGSLLAEGVYTGALLGILAFACFWSIRELFEQERRVKRAGFPKTKRGRDNEFTQ